MTSVFQGLKRNCCGGFYVGAEAPTPKERGEMNSPLQRLLARAARKRPREILLCATRRTKNVRRKKPGRSAQNDNFE
jgi:hypothetical protein